MAVPDSSIRPLKFPLKNPLVSSAPVGLSPIANDVVAWITDNPEQRVTVYMELSLNEYVALASSIDAGRDIAYAEASDYIWWLWTRAFVRTSHENESEENANNCNNDESECECMACNGKLPIVYFGGVPYLIQDCGCDGTRYFQLTAAVLNSDNVPQPTQVGSESFVWSGQNTVPESEFGCYADEASAYLVNRAREFSVAVAQFAVQGLDALNPFDDWFDVGLLAGQLLNGSEFQTVSDFTVSAVNSAFADAQFLLDMAEAWDTSLTAITRADIRAWGNLAPNFVGAFPMRSQLRDSWANYLNMASVNQALNIIRAECASGNTLPGGDGFTPAYDWIYEWDFLLNAAGTISGTGGWSSAAGTVAVWDSAGWYRGASGSTNHNAWITTTSVAARQITGVQIFVDAPLAGSQNMVTLFHNGTTSIYATPRGGENPINIEIEIVPITNFDAVINEFPSFGAGDELTKHIEKIRIFGTGTPPTNGQLVG